MTHTNAEELDEKFDPFFVPKICEAEIVRMYKIFGHLCGMTCPEPKYVRHKTGKEGKYRRGITRQVRRILEREYGDNRTVIFPLDYVPTNFSDYDPSRFMVGDDRNEAEVRLKLGKTLVDGQEKSFLEFNIEVRFDEGRKSLEFQIDDICNAIGFFDYVTYR